jgi:hypothetical protein
MICFMLAHIITHYSLLIIYFFYEIYFTECHKNCDLNQIFTIIPLQHHAAFIVRLNKNTQHAKIEKDEKYVNSIGNGNICLNVSIE